MADNEVAEIEVDAAVEAPPVVEIAQPVDATGAGVGREAVEGILSQIKDSRAVLAGASSAKIQNAAGKLTQAITWLEDALRG